MQFHISIKGQVDQIKLPSTKYLWPLFETIINSIQSLEDTDEQEKAIIIEAIRSNNVQQEIKADGIQADAEEPFVDFTVIDNGNGFNENNYKSFLEAYSQLKVKKGCKGIGRFLWLKAFDNVFISSVYQENGEWFQRKFEFSLNGITPDENIIKLDGTNHKRETRVELKGFKSKYRDEVTTKFNVLAQKIVEHCMPYFIMGSSPKIVLKDSNNDIIDINDYYNKNYKSSLGKSTMELKGKEYILYHMLLSSGVDKHELHLCANNREVKAIQLNKKIPNMQKRMDIGGVSGFYIGYLSGDYLDESVNATRSGFEFANMPLVTGTDVSDENEIVDNAVELIKEHLKTDLDRINVEKKTMIDRFVQSTCPKYRYLLNANPSVYDSINYGLSDEKLELELFQYQQKWERTIARQGTAVEEKIRNNAMNEPAFDALFNSYCQNVTNLSCAGLAEYVARRKVVINLFEKALQLDENSKYQKEKTLHSIICPMQKSSDEMKEDEMNLWLIDDRLAYHHYLASDKMMKSLPVLENNVDKRMDIAIFDEALSYTADPDNISSITIVELKRPMRDDNNNDPVLQVLKYVKDIKSGKIKKADGRGYGDMSHVSFYCYVIADLTESVRESAESRGLTETQDKMGYFGFNTGYGAYVEVISYDKLLKDAKQRNKVLFDKLFNPKLSDVRYFTGNNLTM